MTRYLFVCAVLLVFAPAAFADGEYQRTKNGRTMVWNNDPKPDDEAAWTGGRDREGYATGFGTLTWYTGPKQTVKRLGILPVTKSGVYARYFGNMVRGKFNGPVNVHTNGKTAYAVFVDGVRTDRWVAGPAPLRKMPQPRVEVARQEATAEAAAKRSNVADPAAPAEGPVHRAEDRGQRTEVSAQRLESADRTVSKPVTNKKPRTEMDESLSALVGPPSSLHTNPDAGASPADAKQEAAAVSSVDPRLTKDAVVDLADTGARTRGYNPAEYQRAAPQYHPADQIWSINYEQKSFDETMEGGKRFSVTVDDKTKGIVIVPGK
ncbi:MAG: hypothetical protein M3R29_04705 [Verrucomicrobiota bacterium]|nr:hypothetical protein [Verrucomicrobiota bacterium]